LCLGATGFNINPHLIEFSGKLNLLFTLLAVGLHVHTSSCSKELKAIRSLFSAFLKTTKVSQYKPIPISVQGSKRKVFSFCGNHVILTKSFNYFLSFHLTHIVRTHLYYGHKKKVPFSIRTQKPKKGREKFRVKFN
jgi:hypothetical protein